MFHQRFPFLVLLLVALACAHSGCMGNGSFQNRPRLAPDSGSGMSGHLPVMDDGGGGGASSARPDAANGHGGDGETSNDASSDPMDGVAPPTDDAIASDRSPPVDSMDAGANLKRRYEAESGSLFGQAVRIPCASCSGGQRVSLSADSGFTLNSIDVGGAATQRLVVYYTNGDSVPRTIYVGINGLASQVFPAFFPPTGGWNNVASVALSLSGFRAGSNNEVTVFIDSEQHSPDIDFVEVGPMPNFTAKTISAPP